MSSRPALLRAARRAFRVVRRASLLLLAGLAACGGGEPTADPEPRSAAPVTDPPRAQRPVVLWLVDTLRADHLSTYGYRRPTSPQLDRLAAEAVVFEHCQAQSTWTKPATASLLTGRHPSEHGVNYPSSRLPADVQTVAQVLAAEGYRTGAFVTNGMMAGGFDRGFEEWRAYYPLETDLGYARAEEVVDDVLAWLDRDDGRPYFLYVHLFDPHAPYDPPSPWREEFSRGYDGDLDGYLFHGDESDPATMDLEGERLEHLLDLYDAEIAYADAQLGRVLDLLEERGDDPLFVFVSDHGEEFGDHGGWQHNPHMFQEVTHVPLVVRFPSGWSLGGARRPEPVAQIDLLPTVADVLGIGAPDDLPGRSLAGPAAGRGGAPRVLFGEVDRGGIVRKSALAGELKYVRQWSPEPQELLFDLAVDPAESEDLAGVPGAADGLRARLDRFLRSSRLGYALVVRNFGDEAAETILRVASTEPLAAADPLFAEEATFLGGLDGPLWTEELERDGGLLTLTSYRVRTRPGDHDGLVFQLAGGEESVSVAVELEGAQALLPAPALLLGAAPERAEEVPLTFSPGEGRELLAPGWTPLDHAPAADLDAVLWWAVGEEAPEADLGAELEQHLEGLGYTVGGD